MNKMLFFGFCLCLVPAAGSLAAASSAGKETSLTPCAYQILKPGSVKAESWLARQLIKQKDGLTGHAEELYDDIGQSDWLTGGHKGDQYEWERGPYYAKGLLALAATLDDQELLAKAKKWAEAYLGSQRENGQFGPKDGNWWANMLVLHFLRDWAELTGDERVVPFLEKYFRGQKTALLKKAFGDDSMWAACRGGDELEVVLWLYERTKNPEWLDFARLVMEETCDWAQYYEDSSKTDRYLGKKAWYAYQPHIVNLNQGLKTPALFWRLTKEESQRKGWEAATSKEGWMMKQCGRADGMVNGTEPITDRSTTGGTELCAQAERILSDQVAFSVLGDAKIAEDMEAVAYNTLPATLEPQIRGLRYYCILNQPVCRADENLEKGGGYGFACNASGLCMTPGPNAGYGCCRSNFHFAWPKFVMSLWLGDGNGLIAASYGPCRVKAKGFEIQEATDYPFRDKVEFNIIAAPKGERSLSFRIPSWAKGADLSVNGQSINCAVQGTMAKIKREWKANDKVTLSLSAEVTAYNDGSNGSAYIRRGALIFAYPVPNEKREIEKLQVKGFKTYELLPKSPWNVALALPEKAGEIKAELVPSAEMPLDPFNPETPAVSLKLKGFRTDLEGWGTFCQGSAVKAKEPPLSPIVPPKSFEDLVLVPLGATQVRITYFPWAVTK